MKKIKSLNNYQWMILIVMTAMSLIFAVVYLKTLAREGYKYKDALLVHKVEDGNTVYSGKIEGVQAQFIVSNDNTVVFHYGDKTYGPYTIIQDSTAIPENDEMSGAMTGIEVREGNEILFRGGVIGNVHYYSFYNEDGSVQDSTISYIDANGSEWDMNGNPVDGMKPSLSTIYGLTQNPELTHKGIGVIWFFGVFLCIYNAVSIFFADEMFRLDLVFRVRNVDTVEPSEWEIKGRYIGWAVLPVMALIIFMMGLNYVI